MKKGTKILFAILCSTVICNNSWGQTGFKVNPQSGCTGSAVDFTNTSSGSYKFAHFDFGDGTDSYGDNLQHVYTSAGNYTVTMWLLKNDGTKTSPVTQTVKIEETPSIEIADDSQMAHLTVTTNQSVSYEWYLGGNKLNGTSNTLFYHQSGTYSVTIKNSSGCTASAEMYVSAQSSVVIERQDPTAIKVANNVITPGLKDGINDVLFINDLEYYEHPLVVVIYDKRGKIVYRNYNYSNTDGFQGNDEDGNELFAGTYYYVIKSQGRKGVTGFVDIIR